MGLARMGSTAGNGSGDIFIAFSTANSKAAQTGGLAALIMLPIDRMDPLFEAVVQATEESVINALVAGETMVGRDDNKVLGLPYDRVREIFKTHNRLVESKQ
jgi:D-aminopeptidase